MNGFLNTSNIIDIEVHKEDYSDNRREIQTDDEEYNIVLDTDNKGNNVLIQGRMIFEAGINGAVVVLNIYKDNTDKDPIDIIEMPVNSDAMEAIDLFSYTKLVRYQCRKQRFIITVAKKEAGTVLFLRGYTISFMKFHK